MSARSPQARCAHAEPRILAHPPRHCSKRVSAASETALLSVPSVYFLAVIAGRPACTSHHTIPITQTAADGVRRGSRARARCSAALHHCLQGQLLAAPARCAQPAPCPALPRQLKPKRRNADALRHPAGARCRVVSLQGEDGGFQRPCASAPFSSGDALDDFFCDNLCLTCSEEHKPSFFFRHLAPTIGALQARTYLCTDADAGFSSSLCHLTHLSRTSAGFSDRPPSPKPTRWRLMCTECAFVGAAERVSPHLTLRAPDGQTLVIMLSNELSHRKFLPKSATRLNPS